jgi:hypothetical protein
MTKDQKLREILEVPSLRTIRTLEREAVDAAWADYGKAIAGRLHDGELITVINRASLKSISTREVAGYLRAYLLTGAKP